MNQWMDEEEIRGNVAYEMQTLLPKCIFKCWTKGIVRSLRLILTFSIEGC